MARETDDPRVMVRMPAEMVKGLEYLGRSWADQRPASGSRFLHQNGEVKLATVIREVIADRLEGGRK